MIVALTKDVYGATNAAHAAGGTAIAAIQPLQTAGKVEELLSGALTEREFSVGGAGSLGHGLEFTERPSLSAGDRTILRPCMCLAMEPTVLIGADRPRVVPFELNIQVTGTARISNFAWPRRYLRPSDP